MSLGTYRVIYGEVRLRHKDFAFRDGMLNFVRSLLRRHPDWTIGDSWRDQIFVCRFDLGPNGPDSVDVNSDVLRSFSS